MSKENLNAIKSILTESVIESLDKAYSEGLADGAVTTTVPSTDPVPSSDKIYSQAELDAAVSLAVTAKADEIKAKVKALYEAEQAAEGEVEKSLADSIDAL